jgi:tRNA-dihydrouridine synthase B
VMNPGHPKHVRGSRMRIGTIELPTPALYLAPMEDVSEKPFRRICRRLGADVVVTEFISAEGLIRDAAKSRAKTALAPDEHPVGIQIFGGRDEALVEAARLSAAAGADFVDINYGCPVKKVVSKGAGAGVLKDLPLMERLTRAVVRSVSIPVTVKTRLGWDEKSLWIEEAALRLQDAGAQALAIHARTRRQGYGGSADWDWIARVKAKVGIPVIGNGDVTSPQAAARMLRETGCDGIMLGRAAIGNPWIFGRCRHYLETGEDLPGPSYAERTAVLLEQLREHAAEKGERRAVIEFRKFIGGYIKGFPGVSKARAGIMGEETVAGVEARLRRFGLELARGGAGTVGEPFAQTAPTV